MNEFENDNEKEKLSRFAVAVNEKIDEQINCIISEAHSKKQDIIKSAEDETLNEMYERIQYGIKQINSKYKMIKAQVMQDNKKEILLHREMLAKQVFENIGKRIIEFTESSDYASYLCRLLSGVKITGDTVIRLCERDMKHKEKLSEAVKTACEFEIDKSIRLGGLSVFDKKSLVIEDKTLDNALDEQKKQFCYNYSFTDKSVNQCLI